MLAGQVLCELGRCIEDKRMLEVCYSKTDIGHQMGHQEVGSLVFLLEIPVVWVDGIEQVHSTTEKVTDLVDHSHKNF